MTKMVKWKTEIDNELPAFAFKDEAFAHHEVGPMTLEQWLRHSTPDEELSKYIENLKDGELSSFSQITSSQQLADDILDNHIEWCRKLATYTNKDSWPFMTPHKLLWCYRDLVKKLLAERKKNELLPM